MENSVASRMIFWKIRAKREEGRNRPKDRVGIIKRSFWRRDRKEAMVVIVIGVGSVV